jgi:hypothetical protein
MTIGLILSLLVGGLALLLARETRLRRALQALCNRLLNRLAETSRQHFPPTNSYRHRPRRR